MYKVLLVDDDSLVRQTLKAVINWEKHGFQIVGEAIDGLDAMEKIDVCNPDILVLDMSMPQADGIEVIKYVQKGGCKTKILVLSCYDDFSYVKEALKLGANDYMLKHLMKEDSLIESLLAIKHDIESARRKNQAMDHMEQIAKEGASLLKNRLLLKLLYDQTNSQKSEQEFKQYCKNLQPNNLALIYIKVQDYIKVIKKNDPNGSDIFFTAFSNTVYEVFESGHNYEIANCEDGKFVILVNISNSGQLENKKYLDCAMTKVGQALSEKLRIEVQAISSINCTSYLKLWKIYEQLDNKINHFFYEKSDKKYLIAEDFSIVSAGEIKVDDYQIRAYKEYIKKSRFSLLREALMKEFSEITKDRIVPAHLKTYYISLISTMYSYIYEHFDMKRDYVYMETTTRYILDAGNIGELLTIVMGITDHAEMLISNDLIPKVENDYVKEAIQYIQCHYMKDIILTDVANHIHVSSTYFSYLFKQNTGMKFIDYIKEIRMKKACEYLLDANMKVKKIGELVGMPNRKYFSKAFKEYTGMSPQEYKKRNI
ncbi:MAG TPA: response regulator [Clostridia bacterium]|nr:response regulator [Clostridia bacterium]